MSSFFDDTICAIATPAGSGAIAVIRLSGNKAIQIIDSVYTSPKKGKQLVAQPANTIHFGSVMHQGQLIDEVLISLFKAPHSYTGEDSVEVSCHGSVYIQQKLMQLLLKQGARLADPGEFTMRAFLNGKMDLAQAEAVADVIASESDASHKLAMHQMRGGFAAELDKLRNELLQFVSLIELELDFSEEDVEFANRDQLKILLHKIDKFINRLIGSFSLGNVIKNGIPVAIIGEPNVGKSTLLNALLNEEKAIVSDIAGTTRDSIEDTISVRGKLFRFIDTAGLRETTDTIESMGIKRTRQKIDHATLVLKLVDLSESITNNIASVKRLQKLIPSGKHLILVLNKLDLATQTEAELIEAFTQVAKPERIVLLSAKHKQQLDKLEELLFETVNLAALNHGDVVVSNVRHYDALTRGHEALQRALNGIEAGMPTDLFAQDIRGIISAMGEITGKITTDEILGNIFKNFCIGK